MTFKVGDFVQWTSQSAGTVTTKQGKVIQVVPPGGAPEGVRRPGTSRNHESYVVRASYDLTNGKKRSKTYWPIASKLQPVAPLEATLVKEDSDGSSQDQQ